MGGTNKINARELVLIEAALNHAAIVAITDVHGAILHANDKFCEVSKYSRAELLGQNHRILKSGHHPPDFFRNLWKTIANGKIWEGEIRNRAKDGSLYWVSTCIVPFLDEAGKPYKYVSIRYDITKRKEAESRLEFYAKRLEASNQELQDFASIAAHDLQEPLRKVMSYLERIFLKHASGLSPEGKELIAVAKSSAARMQTLINDLLIYSRVSMAAEPYERVDLNAIVRDVLADLELRVEQTQAEVLVGELPAVEASPAQMRQLFQNLIGNSLKFHKPGVPPVVKVVAALDRGSCLISVVDNGIGFANEYREKVFGIFQRLHGRGDYEGTGIGLAVCQRIAERHGGKIAADSEPGNGARFLVTLPLLQPKGLK